MQTEKVGFSGFLKDQVRSSEGWGRREATRLANNKVAKLRRQAKGGEVRERRTDGKPMA